MSAALPSACACPTPVSVSVPGSSGVNSYSVVISASPTTVPAVSGSVTLTVDQNLWVSVGMYVYLANAGYFLVTALVGTTGVTMTYSNTPTNTNSGVTILAGWVLVPAGYPGTLANPLPVANGGTGSSTAANARTALSAAQSGANNDITSLTALSTPITLAQGGTGQATALLALSALITAGKTSTFTANGTTPVVVNNANVTANSVIIWSYKSGAAPSTPLYISAISAGASFTIKNTAADSALYNYIILN